MKTIAMLGLLLTAGCSNFFVNPNTDERVAELRYYPKPVATRDMKCVHDSKGDWEVECPPTFHSKSVGIVPWQRPITVELYVSP